MNKQAQKLKAKRRAEREAAKMEKVNKVWEDISQYSESNGLPVMKKTKEQMLKVYNARKQVDAKVLNMAAVVALLCSLITLYKEYNCNKEKLLEYSSRLRKFIINIAKNNRDVLLLMEEIELDYKVPIVSRCKNLPMLQMSEFNKYSMETTIIKSTVDNFPYFLCINTYCFMNWLAFTNVKSWNSEDLEKFVSSSFLMYERILDDTHYMHTLNEILITECQVCVDLNTGTVNEIIYNQKGEK